MSLAYLLKQKGIPFLIPEKPLPGAELIVASDLVLSGGGTMAREAAVLGVPSYTFFQGPKGAVDEYLEKEKRLVFIRDEEDIEKITLKKKEKFNLLEKNSNEIISFICSQIKSLIQEQ